MIESLNSAAETWKAKNPAAVKSFEAESSNQRRSRSTPPGHFKKGKTGDTFTAPSPLSHFMTYSRLAGWSQGGFFSHLMLRRIDLLSIDDEDMAKKIVAVMNEYVRPMRIAMYFGIESSDQIDEKERGLVDLDTPALSVTQCDEPTILREARERFDPWKSRKQTESTIGRLGTIAQEQQAAKEELAFDERRSLMLAIARVDEDAAASLRQLGRRIAETVLGQDSMTERESDATWAEFKAAQDEYYRRFCTRPDTPSKLSQWLAVKLRFLEMADRPETEGRAAYRDAKAFVVNIRQQDPKLPPSPPQANDPYCGLQMIREWSLDSTGKKAATNTQPNADADSTEVRAPEGEWTEPMSKTEMARRIRQKHKARWRQVEKKFPPDYVSGVTDRTFNFRIDHLSETEQNRAHQPFD